MAGGKGAHVGSRFIRQLRMKRALGIPWNHKMGPVKQMRGRDRRRGTWWNRKLNCITIEGQDFAQDTQEGGADEFELIPDSDEKGVVKGSSLPLLDSDEYVPETEPQDVVTVSKITGPCANQGRRSWGSMLHDWLRAISDMEIESGKVDMESSKLQIDSLKLEKSGKMEMDSDKLVMCAKVQMGSLKLEESGLVEMDSGKEELDHIASFSDLETDDETCWFQDSQVEDNDVNEKGVAGNLRHPSQTTRLHQI